MSKTCPAPAYVRQRPSPPVHDGDWFIDRGRREAFWATFRVGALLFVVLAAAAIGWLL